jgi:hypothetical protein
LQPNIFTISPTATTNSIEVPIPSITDNTETAENGSSGIAKIEYKLDNGEYSETIRIWGGLIQGSNHTVYVKAIDNAGNEREVSKEVTVRTVPGSGSIILTPSMTAWTKGDVTVKITANVDGYTLQYSTNETNWTNITSGDSMTMTANGTVYARLWDGTNAGVTATRGITNIDKVAPNTFTIAPTATTNGITCPVPSVTDNAETSTNGSSGIAKIEYKLNSGGTYSASTSTWGSLVQNTNYTVYVKSTDNAGNVKEITKLIKTGTVPGGSGSITLTPSTTAWTNKNVTVRVISSIGGYTLQYSTNNSTWTNITSGNSMTMTANGTVYARLTDGANIGVAATKGITNIDKTAPNSFNINYTPGDYQITAYASTSDGTSGINRYEYYLGGVLKASTGTSYTHTGLNQYYDYTLFVRAYDNAGNYRDSNTVTTRPNFLLTKEILNNPLYMFTVSGGNVNVTSDGFGGLEFIGRPTTINTPGGSALEDYLSWRCPFNFNKYNKISFNVRKGADNGVAMMYLGDNHLAPNLTNIFSKWYDVMNSNWAYHEVDLRSWWGEKELFIIGGYINSSGNPNSTTYYYNIRLHAR